MERRRPDRMQHAGRQLAQRLMAAGEPVRALGRSPEKLATLAAAGAEILSGGATEAGYLACAMRGVEAVFTMMPFDPVAPDFIATSAAMARRPRRRCATAEVLVASGVSACFAPILTDLARSINDGR